MSLNFRMIHSRAERRRCTRRPLTTSALRFPSKAFSLPDSRRLSYLELGNSDGRPLLYFHGYPSSRLEAIPIHRFAEKHGIRLIAIDRPGWGQSSPLPGRSFSDWSHDVQNFATGLNLSQFGVLGASGGGPFALSCAKTLPKGLLTCVGLFASAPAWEAGRENMTKGRRLLSWAATHWPKSSTAALDCVVAGVNIAAKSPWGKNKIDSMLEVDLKKTRGIGGDLLTESRALEVLRQREREQLMDMLLREPFRQGSSASVAEAQLLSAGDWGFRLHDIDFTGVRIWHGAEDTNSPAVMIRYMAARIPKSIYREFPGATHYDMFPYIDEVLSELASDMERNAR